MVNLIAIFIGTAAITVVGGGAAYLLWLWTRPKPQTWRARVYELGDGVKPPVKDAKGNIVSDVSLRDLRPLHIDVLKRLMKEDGTVLYVLQKLQKVTNPVDAPYCDVWPGGDREVNVLFHEGSCTLLKKGYDSNAGDALFQPMPFNRLNMVTSEVRHRKQRLKREKDVLEAITPWVVAGIVVIGLIGVAYIMVDGFLQINEEQVRVAELWHEVVLGVNQTGGVPAGGGGVIPVVE